MSTSQQERLLFSKPTRKQEKPNDQPDTIMRGLGERPRGAAKQECFMALWMAGWHEEGVGGLAGTGTAHGGLWWDSGGTLVGLWWDSGGTLGNSGELGRDSTGGGAAAKWRAGVVCSCMARGLFSLLNSATVPSRRISRPMVSLTILFKTISFLPFHGVC